MEANWKPLESKLGVARCAGFMFMGRVNGINLYKHGINRTYLNLDDAENCYVMRAPGCYEVTDFDHELKKLEECLKVLGASLETAYDDAFIAEKRAALRQQGISLVTLQIEPEEKSIHQSHGDASRRYRSRSSA